MITSKENYYYSIHNLEQYPRTDLSMSSPSIVALLLLQIAAEAQATYCPPMAIPTSSAICTLMEKQTSSVKLEIF